MSNDCSFVQPTSTNKNISKPNHNHYNMAPVARFPLFRALPPELRLGVWRQALLAPTVWSVDVDWVGDWDTYEHFSNISKLDLSLSPMGPASYLAGFACKESRQLMQQLFTKPLRGSSVAVESRIYWINWDTTIVHLGNYLNLELATCSAKGTFSEDEILHFRHISLDWTGFLKDGLACRLLAKRCPDIRTLIIRLEGEGVGANLTESAAVLTTLLESHGPERSQEILRAEEYVNTANFRSFVIRDFGESPPRIHFLLPASFTGTIYRHHSLAQSCAHLRPGKLVDEA